ncbi:discoidin domain-containing protein [Cohnella sp. GCM10027633]|uniref:discoidin domain-containing protein n=1 Tax=unclassified Cohnella TaxID=2636738 RepID=UPI0036402ACB
MSIVMQSWKKRLAVVIVMSLLLATAQLSVLNKASASTNLILGCCVWASSGANPINTVDGVQNTFWQSADATGWITADLGSEKAVNQIVIKAPAYGYWVQGVKISTSNSTDDGSFVTQSNATYGFYSANGYTNTINLPATVNTRYVRVQVTAVSTWTAIGSLEIYGP